jgi:queuine tRNA-ribosyltransferase
VRLRNARHAADRSPIEAACGCYTCRNFSRGALRYLFLAREMLGPTLVTMHNLHFFGDLMAAIRTAIAEGQLAERSAAWRAAMYADAADVDCV